MRRILLATAMVMAITAQITPLLAEERIALVIGNASYKGNSKLNNPVNDAKLISSSLESVGFDVTVEVDSDFRSMARAIRQFGSALRAAGPDAVGLFYYAGHGVQVQGTNYMIPLHAELQNEADLGIEGVSAQTVLSQMQSAGNALNIVILDACRNNPFKGSFRSLSRGLARMNAPSGSLVAYAAAPGQVAADSDGANNSPYTKALATALVTPGLTLEQTFKKVRAEVERATAGRQTPWEESSLKGEFYFKESEPTPVKTATLTSKAQKKLQTPNAAETRPNYDRAFELSFWDSVKDSEDVEAYEAYLTQFPNGTFSALAGLKIRRLKTKLRTSTTTKSTTGVASASKDTSAPDQTKEILTLDGKWIANGGNFVAELVVNDGEFRIVVRGGDVAAILRGSGKIDDNGDIGSAFLAGPNELHARWLSGTLKSMKMSGAHNQPASTNFRFRRESD